MDAMVSGVFRLFELVTLGVLVSVYCRAYYGLWMVEQKTAWYKVVTIPKIVSEPVDDSSITHVYRIFLLALIVSFLYTAGSIWAWSSYGVLNCGVHPSIIEEVWDDCARITARPDPTDSILIRNAQDEVLWSGSMFDAYAETVGSRVKYLRLFRGIITASVLLFLGLVFFVIRHHGSKEKRGAAQGWLVISFLAIVFTSFAYYTAEVEYHRAVYFGSVLADK